MTNGTEKNTFFERFRICKKKSFPMKLGLQHAALGPLEHVGPELCVLLFLAALMVYSLHALCM